MLERWKQESTAASTCAGHPLSQTWMQVLMQVKIVLIVVSSRARFMQYQRRWGMRYHTTLHENIFSPSANEDHLLGWRALHTEYPDQLMLLVF